MRTPRFLLLVVAFVFAGLSLAAPAKAEDRYGEQKVVYHINYSGGDASKAYRTALNNVQNHINAVGRDRLTAKVLLHGDGVNLLREAVTNEKLQSDVTSLKAQGVQFLICNNTLKGRNIDYENDLFEVFEEDIVPSGVAELSRLQQQDYTYIKP
jgi:intracellular sulfur oxidation DsrE/DsrF family protein